MVAGRVDFNCNSFTSDCVGFLTGGSIPSWIKGASPTSLRRSLTLTRHADLPSDFLSTPFGAALRPTIDAMFRRPTGPTPPAPAGQQPIRAPASSLLQGVAD